MIEILTVAQVLAQTGLSRSTLRRIRQSGRFPNAVRLSPNRIGFFAVDVRSWLDGHRTV